MLNCFQVKHQPNPCEKQICFSVEYASAISHLSKCLVPSTLILLKDKLEFYVLFLIFFQKRYNEHQEMVAELLLELVR
jgi:hypothetical protein